MNDWENRYRKINKNFRSSAIPNIPFFNFGGWRGRRMIYDGSSPVASDSPYQGYPDRADSYSLFPSENGNNTEMANLPTDMELELTFSPRNSTRTPSPQPQCTPCEQLKFNKAQLAKMETFHKCKQSRVDALKMMPDHYPEEPFYVPALTELQDIEETMAQAVSDIDSFEP
ncbi:hypothetical protein TNCV_4572051 [Trichonephila clavipes]|nr:hypothetical protein TNCV_4572051 [Trichonephila clavipes]